MNPSLSQPTTLRFDQTSITGAKRYYTDELVVHIGRSNALNLGLSFDFDNVSRQINGFSLSALKKGKVEDFDPEARTCLYKLYILSGKIGAFLQERQLDPVFSKADWEKIKSQLSNFADKGLTAAKVWQVVDIQGVLKELRNPSEEFLKTFNGISKRDCIAAADKLETLKLSVKALMNISATEGDPKTAVLMAYFISADLKAKGE